jgi:ribosomal protein S11
VTAHAVDVVVRGLGPGAEDAAKRLATASLPVHRTIGAALQELALEQRQRGWPGCCTG